MARHPDWSLRLAEFIEQRRAKPFAWGSNDCCTFAADAVLAMTGSDPIADLRADIPMTAMRKKLRTTSLRDLVQERLGDLHSAALAQRGDVVLIEQSGGHLLGICLGRIWAAPGPKLLSFWPMDMAIGHWPIGR